MDNKPNHWNVLLKHFLILQLALFGLFTAPVIAKPSISHKHWNEFRDLVPGHFQDWILAGKGPRYTLIYAEPPPAYRLNEYGPILKSFFRGYESHRVKTRPLGYNGQVSDLVIELDYGSAKGDIQAAIERDLQNLSMMIYGTMHGARLLLLSELAKNPPADKAPEPASISAAQLNEWLYGEPDQRLTFFSPELGRSGDINELSSANATGRFLSVDNSLVALIVDVKREIGFSSISAIRTFAIDSDYILGGVVDENFGIVVIIGRARQVPLADFPALRVEDITNAMFAKERNWAQSYDRNTPGAGRNDLDESTAGDWAPSYLSADLLDTEFGSLLNFSDAVLKSQSLSNTVKYTGYQIMGFPDPPYPEGVFDRLQNKIGLSSLIFNFNTVGSGHWLSTSEGIRIFALNSTGSFTVTYSPSTTGQDSELSEAQIVHQAEKLYTDWFEKQQSIELIRTVQYMGVYQLFGASGVVGPELYPDRSKMFRTIGNHLKSSVKTGIDVCLERSTQDESNILTGIGNARNSYSTITRFSGTKPPMPSSIEELKLAVSNAATAIRYDGNLFGDKYQALLNKGITLQKQLINVTPKTQALAEKYVPLERAFKQKYRQYETGTFPVFKDGQEVGERTEYRVPDYKSGIFTSDKQELTLLEKELNPLLEYFSDLASDLESISKKIREMNTEFGSRDLLLGALQLYCSGDSSNSYVNTILKSFATNIEDLRGDDIFSISTPTIVISQGKGTGVGGHNVEIQDFKVRLDTKLSTGQYRFSNGELRISPLDAPKIGQISRSFAKAVDADPGAQRKVFQAALEEARNLPMRRSEALKLAPSENVADLNSVRPVESTRIASLSPNSTQPSDAIVFGRDAKSNRLYFERPMQYGTSQRTIVFGANLSPELIDHAAAVKDSSQVVKVIFDSSLSANDANAIVANYKNATYLTKTIPQQVAAGGGGWGIPPKLPWGSASGGDFGASGGKPRMVIFEDKHSKRRRVVVETDRGRAEFLLSRTTESNELLRVLETKIESGAELTLTPTKSHENGLSTKLLLTDFEIIQSKPIAGKLVAKSESTGVSKRVVDSLRGIFSTVFRAARDEPKRDNLVADYIVEVKRQVEALEPGWVIEGEVQVEEIGMRFVLRLLPASTTLDSKSNL